MTSLSQERFTVLDIQVSQTNNQITLVTAQGRIDSSTAGDLGAALTSVIDGGQHRIVLDIGGVDYMSSAGLREMVSALKKVRGADGDMRIAQVTERVYDVFELSGLNTIFQIFDSQAEALGSF
jgi:anti-sigma B factor antagonist